MLNMSGFRPFRTGLVDNTNFGGCYVTQEDLVVRARPGAGDRHQRLWRRGYIPHLSDAGTWWSRRTDHATASHNRHSVVHSGSAMPFCRDGVLGVLRPARTAGPCLIQGDREDRNSSRSFGGSLNGNPYAPSLGEMRETRGLGSVVVPTCQYVRAER